MVRIIVPMLLAAAGFLANFANAQVPARPPIQIADNAPDTYIVVKGDTLWDISGRFLKQPWRWPEVWRMNRSQIANPHLIYPGQVILLDRNGPYLSIGKRIGSAYGKGEHEIKPRIYDKELEEALPSIPVHLIEPFLSRPLVIDQNSIKNAATIVAAESNRVILASGDTIFAKDITGDALYWQIFRPAEAIKNPSNPKEILGYEAKYLGNATVTEHGNPTTLKITSFVEEIRTGDHLIQAERPSIFAYMPHAPEKKIRAQVASFYKGVSGSESGRYSVITLAAGKQEGLELGHVMALHRNRGTVEYKDEITGKKEIFKLPDERYGLVFVFRVFDRISYALVMDTEGPVRIGDYLQTP